MAEQEAVEFLGRRLDAFLQRIALPGQRDFRARRMPGSRNAPGDRAVVGDAEDHPTLALHQPLHRTRLLRHLRFQSTWLPSRRTPAPLPGAVQISLRLTLYP